MISPTSHEPVISLKIEMKMEKAMRERTSSMILALFPWVCRSSMYLKNELIVD